jgi:hypothetical protein
MRFIGRFIITVTVLAVLGLIAFSGALDKPTLASAMTVVRRVLGVEAVIALIVYYGWHYFPGMTQRWIYPHIEDTWDGTINYFHEGKHGRKEAVLHVSQSLVRIRLVLETDESVSETLVVRPERDSDFSRFRLFYIYENRQRDGLPNNGRSYRGTALIELGPGKPSCLVGTYFTDQRGTGTIEFRRRRDARKWYWGWWRALTEPKGVAGPVKPEVRWRELARAAGADPWPEPPAAHDREAMAQSRPDIAPPGQ